MRLLLVTLLLLALQPTGTQARGRAPDTRPAHSFSQSRCVRPACFAKHRDGRYWHPNAGGTSVRHPR